MKAAKSWPFIVVIFSINTNDIAVFQDLLYQTIF